MRPRKVVLCVAADEDRLSERAFLLETRGYRVHRAQTIEEALDELRVITDVDVLLVDLPLSRWEGTKLREARRTNDDLRTILVSNCTGFENDHTADVFLPPGGDSPAELLERLRILVARKRGPKKKVSAE